MILRPRPPRPAAAPTGGAGRGLAGAELREELGFDVEENGRVLDEVLDRVLAALPEALLVEAEPGPRLLDDLVLAGEVHDVARPRDPPVEEDVELGRPE